MRAALITLVLAGCATAEPAMPAGTSSESCGSCHAEQYDAWRASSHARGTSSEAFQALLPHVEEAWGETAGDRCVSCHSPGHGENEAIGCVSCHGAIGNTAEHSGRLVVDLDRPLAGPSGEAVSGAPHAVRAGDFLGSASLCGTCHEVRGPGLFDEPTLTEWRESGLDAVGADCASCHEPHGAPGFDALLGEALVVWIEERDGQAVVFLENASAGHVVPTGVSFLRDVWVDVTVTEASGARREHPRVIELGARVLSGDVEVALITDADRVEPRGLALGEHRSAAIDLGDAGVGVEVEATVRARGIRAGVADALGLDGDHDGRSIRDVARARL